MQSKLMSFLEALANTAVGIVIAYLAQLWFFEAAGIEVTDNQNLALVLFMTVVSIVRSYALRRLFNHAPAARVLKAGPHCTGLCYKGDLARAKFDEECV